MAVQAAIRCSRRLADLVSRIGLGHVFTAEHTRHMHGCVPGRMVLAQAIPQLGQQWIVRHLGQIGHFDSLGHAFAASGPHRNEMTALPRDQAASAVLART